MPKNQGDGLFGFILVIGVIAIMMVTAYSSYRKNVALSYFKQIQPLYAKVEILDITEDKGICPHHKDEKVVFDALSRTGERICGQACCNRGFAVCVLTPNETCSW